MTRYIDLSGKVFGLLKVLSLTARPARLASGRCKYFLVRCDCGTVKTVRGDGLRSGKVNSCGCFTRSKTHGMSHTSEWHAWMSIKKRCNNPKHPAFNNYGGRGIHVSKEWLGKEGFKRFSEHIGNKPSRHYQIDRIDNSRGYVPGNVRWATTVDNQRNRRDSVLLTNNGRTMCISAWEEALGMRPSTIWRRKKLGWSDEEAICIPIDARFSHPKKA